MSKEKKEWEKGRRRLEIHLERSCLLGRSTAKGGSARGGKVPGKILRGGQENSKTKAASTPSSNYWKDRK